MLNWHLKLTDDSVIFQLNGRKIDQTPFLFSNMKHNLSKKVSNLVFISVIFKLLFH